MIALFPRGSRVVTALGALVLAAACSATPGSPAGADAGGPPCPSGRGPTMVRVVSKSAGTFCIDSTEVTRDDYGVFTREVAAGKMSSKLAACANDADPTPDATCLKDPRVCKGDACGRHPQVCVDPCDAAAYCEWAGKRLCRPAASPDAGTSSQGEWKVACSLGINPDTGRSFRRWPYGGGQQLNAETCNIGLRSGTGCGPNPTGCSTLPVGSLPDCQGSVPGVYDLGGNVMEWIDVVPERPEWGAAAGPSFAFGQTPFEADAADCGFLLDGTPRRFEIGFRCCAD
jgi:formylglycine-generating enzyme